MNFGAGPMVVELHTARLRMRPWQIADAEAVRALWAERDPRSRRVLSVDGHPTVDEMRTRIAAQLAASARSGLSLLAIEGATEARLLGYCGLIVGEATEPELAFELFRAERGQGFATEAARAVVDSARRSGRTGLCATVREWNAPSFRVLEKLGFERSGRVDPDAVRGDSVWLRLDLSAR